MKMELKFDKVKRMQDDEGEWLCLRATVPSFVRKIASGLKEKLHVAKISEYRERRSLNANAYAWALMEEIARHLGTSKEEVYLLMLERYGVFTHIIAKPNTVERMKQEWRTVRELGEVTVNGNTGIQLQCYFGSSSYDTKEMARLIDGIVSECQVMGLETLSPDKLDLLKQEWDR